MCEYSARFELVLHEYEINHTRRQRESYQLLYEYFVNTVQALHQHDIHGTITVDALHALGEGCANNIGRIFRLARSQNNSMTMWCTMYSCA